MITLILMLTYILITGKTDETWKPENVEIISFIAVVEVLFEFLFMVGILSEVVSK